MAPGEIFSKLGLSMVNFCLHPYTFCLFSHAWTRICFRNTDPIWIRIQNTKLTTAQWLLGLIFFKLKNFSICIHKPIKDGAHIKNFFSKKA